MKRVSTLGTLFSVLVLAVSLVFWVYIYSVVSNRAVEMKRIARESVLTMRALVDVSRLEKHCFMSMEQALRAAQWSDGLVDEIETRGVDVGLIHIYPCDNGMYGADEIDEALGDGYVDGE